MPKGMCSFLAVSNILAGGGGWEGGGSLRVNIVDRTGYETWLVSLL